MTELERLGQQWNHVELLTRRGMPRDFAVGELERIVRMASYEVHAQRGTRYE